MSYNPQREYNIYPTLIDIRDFFAYPDEFVLRPPYQRKSVWSRKKQQSLLESLFRRYYIPRIILREVRIDDQRSKREIIDGQQRINTVINFFSDDLTLPKSLESFDKSLPGMKYSNLPDPVRRFVDKELKFDVDLVKDIDDPKNREHQKLAAEIFWRLQQGENLNYMEIAHSRLSSRARNFIVKYADDIRFDYSSYKPIDNNPDKIKFFMIYDRDNKRMQHLSLLARLLLIERDDGPTETKDAEISQLIEETQVDDGIDNFSYENEMHAKAVLKVLSRFHKIFKDDPIIDNRNGVKEFRIEYFVTSVYLLLRHLLKYYVFTEKEEKIFKDFVYSFHTRWKAKREDDNDILLFVDNRQQSKAETELRDRIARQLFFEYVKEINKEILIKDEKRVFDESERIKIYRRDKGLCQICLKEGKSEKEAQVSWGEYQADHVIPHCKGGRTVLKNGQVLCQSHNAQKGGK